MNAADHRFVLVEEPEDAAGIRGFFKAVARRLDRKALLVGLAVFAAAEMHARVAHLGQTMLGEFRLVQLPDQWKLRVVSHVAFVACSVLAVLAADEAVARGARRWPTYLAAIVLACAAASAIWTTTAAAFGWVGLGGLPPEVIGMAPFGLFFGGVLYAALGTFVYVNERTARLAADRMRAAQLARAQARRRTLESKLQELQARVEPQFLFNTLAQVGELYERDPAIAGQMLDDLIAYLRAALPHLRESTSTVGREVDLARAYLDIMRVRLGHRLEVEIDVPDAVRTLPLPAMMLLPLVDHALVHGLQPANDAGTLRIETEGDARTLRLRITDSGGGFVRGVESAGLTSLAERLRGLYGDAARFEIERITERATRATLEIPL